jgi:PAS domain S-box-containing protein
MDPAPAIASSGSAPPDAGEVRFRHLADSVAELVWVADGLGIAFANQGWYRYTGIDVVGGSDWTAVIHPDERSLARRRWNRAVATGEAFACECRLRRRDGAYRWFAVSVAREPAAVGGAPRWLGCAADIDNDRGARAELTRREGEIRLVADALPSVIAYVDADQRYRFVNAAYERWFARSRDGIVGRAIAELLEPAAYAHARPWYEKVLRGQPIEFEGPTAFPDGVTRHVRVRYLPDFDERGGTRGFVILIDDITEQKRAEQALRASEEALAAQARQLTESNAELTQFAYVASHDLQAPLRLVRNFLGLLAKRHGASLDLQAREFVAEAIDGAERMQGLIRDLLSYAQVGRTAGIIEAVDLNHVVARILHDLAPEVAEAGATVVVDPLAIRACDRTGVAQVLQNRVGNALKFHRPDKPEIRISATAGDDEWTIAVSDNGIGIPPEHHQRVFEAFQRLHTVAEFPGSGIGLAICKKMVERMGGRISVESQAGSGATFRFTLRKR